MPAINVNCPNCGKQTPTGFDMDGSSLATAELDNNQTRCQHCQALFRWSKSDIVMGGKFPYR